MSPLTILDTVVEFLGGVGGNEMIKSQCLTLKVILGLVFIYMLMSTLNKTTFIRYIYFKTRFEKLDENKCNRKTFPLFKNVQLFLENTNAVKPF